MSTMNVPTQSNSHGFPQDVYSQRPHPHSRQQPHPLHPGAPLFDAAQMMQILEPLRLQIEFYFSPENLSKDVYLQSQLNATEHLGALPIENLCNFRKVRHLHALIHGMGHFPPHMTPPADPMMVRMALEKSKVVNVSPDGAWVILINFRPSLGGNSGNDSVLSSKAQASAPSSPSSHATGSSSVGVPTHPLPPVAPILTDRNVVLLQGVPSSASKEEVLKLFHDHEKDAKSAQSSTANTWRVTFDTQEAAAEAIEATQNAMIADHPVTATLEFKPQKNDPSPSTISQDGTSSVGGNSIASTGHQTASLGPQPLMQPFVVVPAPYGYPFQQPSIPHGHSVAPYAYFPYPSYVMPSMQPGPPMAAFRLQQQHFQQGYSVPMHPRHVQGHGNNQGKGNPPHNVYVKPDLHTSSRNPNYGMRPGMNGDQNVKKHKRRKWNNQGKNQKRANHSTQQPQQQQQHSHEQKGKSKPQLRGDDLTEATSGVSSALLSKVENHGKAQLHTNSFHVLDSTIGKPKKEGKKLDLGAENFPALGGGTGKSTTSFGNARGPVGGYAQALLKKVKQAPSPPKPLTASSSPLTVSTEPTDGSLVGAIGKLSLSEENT